VRNSTSCYDGKIVTAWGAMARTEQEAKDVVASLIEHGEEQT
jgi:hypothetical protein